MGESDVTFIEDNPLAGDELAIYSASAEWADGEPATETLEDLGVVEWSLWAQSSQFDIEIPLAAETSWTTWFSLSQDEYNPDPPTPVSEEFVAATVLLAEGAEVPTDLIDSDLERHVVNQTIGALFVEHTPTPALYVVDWCYRRYDAGVGVDIVDDCLDDDATIEGIA